MAPSLTGIIIAATSIMLVACTQAETVTNSLIKIQNILSENNTADNFQYRLAYNEDFPCQVTISENSEIEDLHWLKQYQFDLTDINKNSFVQSKPGRRAIIYSSTKQTSTAGEKKFKPVKINNFSLQTNVTEKNQRLIITELNKAIALCEEEYSFEQAETETPSVR